MRLVAALLFATAALAVPVHAEEASEGERLGGLMEALRTRDLELDRRARDLDERERTLAELEERIAERLSEIEEIQRTVEERIQAWEGQDGTRIKKLAKVYESMPPNTVAPLLENLELDLATSIVSRMKPKKSAAVLAVMDREEALVLSRRVARPLAPPQSEGGTP